MSAGEAAARGFAGHHGLRLRDAGLSEGTGGLHVWLHAGAAALAGPAFPPEALIAAVGPAIAACL